jgi:deoxyguanosine kinase
MPQANLVIYLSCSVETAMKRIAMRGRDIERNMDRGYMENLIRDYNLYMDEFQRTHPSIPVLTFECDELDYVHRSEDTKYVLSRIEPYLNLSIKE